MRDVFFDELYEIAKNDRRVMLLSADFGAPSLDKWRDKLPDQFMNMGIAEQNMINVARGLAMTGKFVYVYGILVFFLRCYEQIRHLCMQGLPITIVGVGAGFSYCDSGPSHWALEDIAAMRVLPNLTIYNPSDDTTVRAIARSRAKEPTYIRLDRYSQKRYDDVSLGRGFTIARKGSGALTLLAAGNMVPTALEVAEQVDATVIDVYRLKPLSANLAAFVHGKVITIEEHMLDGGFGSLVSEVLPVAKRIGVDRYYFNYGRREQLQALVGLTVEDIRKQVASV